jgi:uncharacterized protein
MMNSCRIVILHLTFGLLLHTPPLAAQSAVPEEDLAQMTLAAPDKPPGAPLKPRKVLIFSRCPGFRHASIPWGQAALRILGEKTGAYQPVVSDDPAMFDTQAIAQFDAIIFNNMCGNPLDEPKRIENLINFVREGGGFVAIHCGGSLDWPQYVEMIGGMAINHPWNSNEIATLTIEEPSHPIVQPFRAARVTLNEEIYQFDDRFSRDRVRVLISLDTSSVDMKRPRIQRTDGDFALAWVKTYGRGRVFYTALGHNKHMYWDPRVLGHFLAGIQYALGDLEAPAEPRAE